MDLGLSRGEFLRMSPREFFALTKRYQEHEERMDRRVASFQAFYHNINTGSKFSADDFMGKPQKKAKRYPTDEQLERQLTTIFGVGPKKQKA